MERMAQGNNTTERGTLLPYVIATNFCRDQDAPKMKVADICEDGKVFEGYKAP